MTADDVTREYLTRCQADERLCSIISTSDISTSYLKAHKLLPRPIFANGAVMDVLGADIKSVFDLVISLPERLFDGDLDKYCAVLGIDEQRTALISRLRHVEPPRSGRADLYRDGDDFKILEFNVNTGLGGADIVEVSRALMATEPFAAFAKEFDLDYTDTMAALAEQLRDAAAPLAAHGEPVIAAIEADGGFASWTNSLRSIQFSLARSGVNLIAGELSQLTFKNGRVYLDDKPIDLMLRYFMIDQLIDDPSAQAVYELVCQVHEQGKLVLQTPPTSHLFNDKATLALLSDGRYRDSFSGPEQELIDRLLPWTRVLREDLLPYGIAHQQELVLKPGAGFAAKGVVAGWETEREEWADLLRRSAGGPFIIQQRVNPTPEAFVDPETGRLDQILPAWGVFFSEHGYNGGFFRASTDPKTSITGGPGTRRASLFTTGTRTPGTC